MNAVNQSTKTTIKGNKTSSILNTIGLKDFQSSTEIDALSGINCLKSVGSMTMSTRDDAIRKFTVDPNYNIILMSLKAGGVALNLAVASHRLEVFAPKGIGVLDPWEIRFLNTPIPPSSGATISWAHHAILAGKEKRVVYALVATVSLALVSIGFQVMKYENEQ
ncbi:hypothetical protein HHK36_023110 [Tetracentron sinense]|uniref:Cytochrome c oxidase subunit 3 n=1 Tax=Tetracentron sinense TaxID=13715 RepID=A0A835D5J7_TETSI|nr:hypothetical protein HHK36_023110 [Tetracentron sinense]